MAAVEKLRQAQSVVDRVIGQTRTLMLFAAGAPVLIMFAVLTYPFEPDRVLALYMAILIVPSALAALFVNVQIGRAPALLSIRQKSGGLWEWERLARLFIFLGVPGAGLVATRCPGTLDWIISMLEPLFNVFA